MRSFLTAKLTPGFYNSAQKPRQQLKIYFARLKSGTLYIILYIMLLIYKGFAANNFFRYFAATRLP